MEDASMGEELPESAAPMNEGAMIPAVAGMYIETAFVGNALPAVVGIVVKDML